MSLPSAFGSDALPFARGGDRPAGLRLCSLPESKLRSRITFAVALPVTLFALVTFSRWREVSSRAEMRRSRKRALRCRAHPARLLASPAVNERGLDHNAGQGVWLSRASAHWMAERTHSHPSAARLLVYCKIAKAWLTFLPRIISTTRRAFCADPRRYFALALASISSLRSQFLVISFQFSEASRLLLLKTEN